MKARTRRKHRRAERNAKKRERKAAERVAAALVGPQTVVVSRPLLAVKGHSFTYKIIDDPAQEDSHATED